MTEAFTGHNPIVKQLLETLGLCEGPPLYRIELHLQWQAGGPTLAIEAELGGPHINLLDEWKQFKPDPDLAREREPYVQPPGMPVLRWAKAVSREQALALMRAFHCDTMIEVREMRIVITQNAVARLETVHNACKPHVEAALPLLRQLGPCLQAGTERASLAGRLS